MKDDAQAPGCVTSLWKLQSHDTDLNDDHQSSVLSYLLFTPERVDTMAFWSRVILLAGFALSGFILIAQDYRAGEMGSSLIHRPLLIFHEAGQVMFRLFGDWMMVLGGTLGQLIMPAILGGPC